MTYFSQTMLILITDTSGRIKRKGMYKHKEFKLKYSALKYASNLFRVSKRSIIKNKKIKIQQIQDKK